MSLDPASLEIVIYPDPVLRQRADAIADITDETRAVAARMIELMHRAEGIGLAAPQVGLSWRLFVAHVPPDDGRSTDETPPTALATPVVFINPAVTMPSAELESHEEGCLSLPEIRGPILRPPQITIDAMDIEGTQFSMRVSGLLARCLQHEFDHIEGILIIDRFPQMARLRTRSAVRALERDAQAR